MFQLGTADVDHERIDAANESGLEDMVLGHESRVAPSLSSARLLP